jgi:hypothetical protein
MKDTFWYRLAALAAVVAAVSGYVAYRLNRYVMTCQTLLGQLGQAVSASVASKCHGYSAGYDAAVIVTAVSVVAAIALVILGIASRRR